MRSASLRVCAFILLPIILSAAADAQTHELVLLKDINTTQSGVGYVGNGTVWNGIHYFTGSDGTFYGLTLWRSDGTAAGTWKMKDVLTVPNSPNGTYILLNTPEVRVLSTLPDSLLFSVRQPNVDPLRDELWRTDGTSAGTVKVADLPGLVNQPLIIGGQCFFFVSTSGGGSVWMRTDGTAVGTETLLTNSFGQQVAAGGIIYLLEGGSGGVVFPPHAVPYKLWRSDGTAAGTILVKEFSDAGTGSVSLTPLENRVLFALSPTTQPTGRELWTSDGTEAGTVMVKDINPGSSSSDPRDFLVKNGTIFFTANDGTTGRELWKSDGTEAGTVRVADIATGVANSDPQGLTPALGGVCFTADDGTHGRELWRTDGTEAGTQLIADVVDGWGSSSPDSLREWKGRVYFSVYTGFPSARDVSLWVTDGTTAGTHVVTDFDKAAGSNVISASFMTANDNFALILAKLSEQPDSSATTYEWWALRGDGSTATRIATSYPPRSYPDNDPTPSAFALGSGLAVFSIRDLAHGIELWSTDGTVAGTQIVKDINAITNTADPGWLGEVNGKLLISANDGVNGREVWSTDGTTTGTRLEADIQPGAGDSDARYGAEFQGEVFFGAFESPGNPKLWRSNGLPGGTVSVASLPANIYDSMLAFGNSLLIPLGELWKSDGTGAGTGVLTHSGGHTFVRAGSEVFFLSSDQLWKTNGNTAGTVMVKDFAVTSPERSFDNSSGQPRMVAGSGGVFFRLITTVTQDGSPNREAWQSDGTDAGTVPFFTGNGANTPKAIEVLTEFGSRTLFTGWDAIHGTELWVKEGGTSFLLRDFFTGTDGPGFDIVRTEAGRVFFSVRSGGLYFNPPAYLVNSGLWVTDGTSAGTVQLSTIPSGPLLEFDGSLIGAGDGIFRTDGTVAGTSRLAPLTYQGVGVSGVFLRAAIGKLFVIAFASQHGYELFRLNAKPVLVGSVAAFTGATWNQAFTFSGSALATLSVSDVDSATTQLRITALFGGTLTVNGQPVSPGVTVISAADTIIFLPPANAHGTTPMFTVQAFDGDSFSNGAATVRVQITSPYEQWLSNSFGVADAHNSALTGPTIDSDGDGLRNGIEYLLNTSPVRPDPAAFSIDVATDAQNKRHPRIVLYRAHPFPASASLSIEESTNLADWTAIATYNGTNWSGTANVVEDSPANDRVRVTVRSAFELNDTAPSYYLRLQAIVP